MGSQKKNKTMHKITSSTPSVPEEPPRWFFQTVLYIRLVKVSKANLHQGHSRRNVFKWCTLPDIHSCISSWDWFFSRYGLIVKLEWRAGTSWYFSSIFWGFSGWTASFLQQSESNSFIWILHWLSSSLEAFGKLQALSSYLSSHSDWKLRIQPVKIPHNEQWFWPYMTGTSAEHIPQ